MAKKTQCKADGNGRDYTWEWNSIEIETLMRTQVEMKMKQKNPVVQLENSMKGLAIRMNQAEDRVSRLEDKIEDIDQISEEHKKSQERNPQDI